MHQLRLYAHQNHDRLGAVAQTIREAEPFGVLANPPEVDLRAVVQRKDRIVEKWRQGLLEHVEKRPSLELIRGDASFTGPHQVSVAGQELSSEKIFINTGAGKGA